jgi:acyl-CoA thioesterase YciA
MGDDGVPPDAARVAANVGPAIRTIAMPADTNPAGDIFGGWLMAQMDLAAGNAAARRAAGRCATVAVDAMTFLKPVFVGDEVSLYADVIAVGRTSLRIAVEAWRRGREGSTAEKVTQAIFTFVAIGDDRKPRSVPEETL